MKAQLDHERKEVKHVSRLPKMPPKRKAAPSAKRPAASAARPGAPASRRQKIVPAAATAAPAEETTTVEVYGFDKEWLKPLYEMYGKRELTDVVLKVGDTCRAVHRVVVSTVSPVLRKMFSSGMAESKSTVIELQNVGELALPALVEFAYTGKIELRGEFFSSRRRPRSPSTSRPVARPSWQLSRQRTGCKWSWWSGRRWTSWWSGSMPGTCWTRWRWASPCRPVRAGVTCGTRAGHGRTRTSGLWGLRLPFVSCRQRK